MASKGTFRRRVRVTTRNIGAGAQEARCAVEDDFHHFRVVIEAREGAIAQVRTNALRSPNTLCAAAGHQLRDLVGMGLDPASAAVLRQTDQFQQCTHQLDLAGLGVAALALGRKHRTYDAIIPDRRDGHTTARLNVDSRPMLSWQVMGMTIERPEPYRGRSMGAGFTEFTASLDRDEAEAALVLRRALFVSQGRGIDYDELGSRGPVGGCWAWQPERLDRLVRLPDNRRDFSSVAADLLSGDDDWLEFRE